MSRTKKYKKRVITDEQVQAKKIENSSPSRDEEEVSKESLLQYALKNGSLPFSMTEEKLLKFFEAINLGASYDTASKYAEMHTGTLYYWMNKAKEDTMANVSNSPYVLFQNKLNKVEAEYEVSLLKDINSMIKERDPFIGHMLKYLSIKFPKKWGNSV